MNAYCAGLTLLAVRLVVETVVLPAASTETTVGAQLVKQGIIDSARRLPDKILCFHIFDWNKKAESMRYSYP